MITHVLGGVKDPRRAKANGINVSQNDLLKTLGNGKVDVDQLSDTLNMYDDGWKGSFVLNTKEGFNEVNQNGPWIAQLRGNPSDHFLVVDGLNEFNEVTMRDPFDQERLTIYWDTFLENWQAAVWK